VGDGRRAGAVGRQLREHRGQGHWRGRWHRLGHGASTWAWQDNGGSLGDGVGGRTVSEGGWRWAVRREGSGHHSRHVRWHGHGSVGVDWVWWHARRHRWCVGWNGGHWLGHGATSLAWQGNGSSLGDGVRRWTVREGGWRWAVRRVVSGDNLSGVDRLGGRGGRGRWVLEEVA